MNVGMQSTCFVWKRSEKHFDVSYVDLLRKYVIFNEQNGSQVISATNDLKKTSCKVFSENKLQYLTALLSRIVNPNLIICIEITNQ